MQNSDKEEFVRILNGLAAIKRVELTEDVYDLWWHAMREWDIGDFKDAAGYLLKTCEFLPAPNDFEGLLKKQKPSAHEAWADALCACMGWRNGTASCDPLTDRVVMAIGGYQEIALCPYDKIAFLERRFIAAYNDFSEGDDVRGALPNLTKSNKLISVGAAMKEIA